MPDLNCYIDESGDEGIETGGSRWFVIGAVVIPSEIDLQESSVVPEIKRTLGRDPVRFVLRWSSIRDHRTKRFVAQELATVPFTISSVMVDKESDEIRNSTFLKNKCALYYYTVRYLIERLSWMARDLGRVARITFEHRSSLDYPGLKTYLQHLRVLIPATSVYWPAVDWKNFRVAPKHSRRWLQVADASCGAIFNALEKDRFGNVEDNYIMTLRDRFYRRGKIFSYGLKIMPTTALANAKSEFDWMARI